MMKKMLTRALLVGLTLAALAGCDYRDVVLYRGGVNDPAPYTQPQPCTTHRHDVLVQRGLDTTFC